MANKTHLAILKKGVKVWNEWRRKNYQIKPDLSDAKLTRADLSEANFNWTNLSGADLSMTNLSGASFIMANLNAGALFDANLSGADLRWTELDGMALGEVNLENSRVGGTRFANVDLTRVKGLESVVHTAPSTIGIDTIYRSKGKIPRVFLRGAGVPGPFIVQMKALVAAMEPIQFYSCFLSYSSKDQEFADRLYADLQGKNVRCWFAPEDMKIGDKIRPKIDEAIRVHDKLLLVLTQNSMKSSWVEKEVETAFEKERKQGRTVLFPIRLDDAVIGTGEAWAADIRRTRHIGDFREWKDHDKYMTAFETLMRDLKAGDEA